jgi:hypothetical protein
VAKFVATDYNIKINGADFTSSIAAVTFDVSAAEQEVTAFGDSFVQRISGLKDASVSLDFHQDFGATSVDATLFPLLGSQATVTVIPSGTVVSATNPLTAVCSFAPSTSPSLPALVTLPHCL